MTPEQQRRSKLLLNMDRENKTALANAFGMMDGLLGDVDGVFGYERAFFQGASQSPAGCVALYDALLGVRRVYMNV